jgi:hypothetical protein
MKAGSSLLAIVKDAPRPEPVKRGQLWFAEDIMALIPGVSRWWVNHDFAPDLAIKVGRKNAWWEHEALAWIDSQRRTRAS